MFAAGAANVEAAAAAAGAAPASPWVATQLVPTQALSQGSAEAATPTTPRSRGVRSVPDGPKQSPEAKKGKKGRSLHDVTAMAQLLLPPFPGTSAPVNGGFANTNMLPLQQSTAPSLPSSSGVKEEPAEDMGDVFGDEDFEKFLDKALRLDTAAKKSVSKLAGRLFKDITSLSDSTDKLSALEADREIYNSSRIPKSMPKFGVAHECESLEATFRSPND